MAVELNSAQEFIPTRKSLLSRLRDWNDQESWKVFFDTYWKLIYNAGLKAGLSDAEAQDMVQETVISVSKKIPEFQYDAAKGSFKSWLLRLTTWRIGDQLRKREYSHVGAIHAARSATGTATVERVADPVSLHLEVTWDEEWEKNLMDAAIERIKKKVDPTQYQIFDLYVFKDWPVVKIARALKINPGKVYLAKHRIGKLVKKEVAHLRTKPL
jgi:RNA polymerase sigma-70 factor (ECF subfamily)